MFGLFSSSFQNSKDAALVRSNSSFHQPGCRKADLQAPLHGQGRHSSHDLDVSNSRTRGHESQRGWQRRVNGFCTPKFPVGHVNLSCLAGSGSSTISKSQGGSSTRKPLPDIKCVPPTQNFGRGLDCKDLDRSRSCGARNDKFTGKPNRPQPVSCPTPPTNNVPSQPQPAPPANIID